LWLFTGNPILVALAGRLIVWALLLYSLVRLAHAWKCAVPLACGLVLFVAAGQTLGAAEWILTAWKAKCCAYAILLLALEAALRQAWCCARSCAAPRGGSTFRLPSGAPPRFRRSAF